MPCEVSAGTNWTPAYTEQPLGYKWCPRQDAEDTPYSRSRATPEDNRKKERLRQSPESWKQVSRTPNCNWSVAHVSVQPDTGGPPTRWLPCQVLRTQNETNKKPAAAPGRERIVTSECLKANSRVTVPRSNSCLYVLCLPV